MAVSIDVVRRVYEQEGEAYLEIGDWPESTDFLSLRTLTDKNKKWFGDINLSMSPEFAESLGKALIDAANDKRSK